LKDVTGSNPTNVVVEVPVGLPRSERGEPWCSVRQRVFSWTDAQFPIQFGGVNGSFNLEKKPVIRVKGRAFYDAEHAGITAHHHDTTLNYRDYASKIAVWGTESDDTPPSCAATSSGNETLH